jgi:hypothetical protein
MVLGLMAFLAFGQVSAKVTTDSTNEGKPVALMAPLDMKRVAVITMMLPDVPKGFGDNYHNRLVWNKLHSDAKYAKTIKTAEGYLNQEFPVWSDEQYMLYFTKGTRPEGEKMMSNRMAWLSPLVWAECMENKGRFVPVIQMVLRELVHQKSWSLPAHDKGKQNIEGRNYTVDLGAAGFAHNVAQALYLLDDKLSAQLRAEVLNAMDKHVFAPVLRSIATGNGDHYWLTVINNWNSVCLAGVTGAALAVIADKQERAKFVTIAERYSKNSIAGFTDEGYCTEGLGYYSYGFGHYILLRENILQATNGAIDLFADPKIKRIAAYAPNLEIINHVFPTIADCHVGIKAPASILWYCSRNLGLGLKQYDNLSFAGSTVNLTDDVMHAFPNSASLSNTGVRASALAPGIRSYFKAAGVLIERPAPGSKAKLGAALKGGNNNEIHNHNDVGSFSIVVGNEMLMGDPGGPFTYTAKTFSAERYTYYKSLASYGHPVPLVAGVQQQEGAQAHAKTIDTTFTDKEDSYAMDISSAYPIAGLTRLTRKFTYNRDDAGSLTVKDDYSFKSSQPFEIAFTTRAQWKQIAPNQIEFSGVKEKMIAIIKTTGGFKIKSETIEENAPEFTRIGITLDAAEKGTVWVTFKPAGE